MLDLGGIISTAILMMFVILRAVQFDAREAWFQTVKPKAVEKQKTGTSRHPVITTPSWRRRG